MCIFISAWASALLVSTGWAVLEPQAVGRVINDSHAFLFNLNTDFKRSWK